MNFGLIFILRLYTEFWLNFDPNTIHCEVQPSFHPKTIH